VDAGHPLQRQVARQSRRSQLSRLNGLEPPAAARGHLRPRAAAAIPDRQSLGLAAVRVRDTTTGYGWISIALHWLAAAIVLTMWTIGIMSQAAGGESDPWLVHLHTTIGMTAYALLWGRIIWRFTVGHPGPLPAQSAFLFP